MRPSRAGERARAKAVEDDDMILLDSRVLYGFREVVMK